MTGGKSHADEWRHSVLTILTKCDHKTNACTGTQSVKITFAAKGV